MNKITLTLALIVALSLTTNAQQANGTIRAVNYSTAKPFLKIQSNAVQEDYSVPGNNEKDYNFYNRRSKNQRIIGLSLLGAGLVLGVAGILVSSNDNYTDNEKRDRTIRDLFILSAATGIASIPFMVMAHASKNKARAALSSQKTSFGIPGKAEKNITGLTLSIPIGK